MLLYGSILLLVLVMLGVLKRLYINWQRRRSIIFSSNKTTRGKLKAEKQNNDKTLDLAIIERGHLNNEIAGFFQQEASTARRYREGNLRSIDLFVR